MARTLDWLTWLKNRPVDGELYFRIVWARAEVERQMVQAYGPRRQR